MKLGKQLILGNSLNHLQSCINIIPGENQLQRQTYNRFNMYNLPNEIMLILEGAAGATPSFCLRTQLLGVEDQLE